MKRIENPGKEANAMRLPTTRKTHMGLVLNMRKVLLAVTLGMLLGQPAQAAADGTISVENVTVHEGAGNATFQLRFNRTTFWPESVDYEVCTASGTATSLAPSPDFTANCSGGQIDVGGSGASAGFSVPITNDTADEFDETFRAEIRDTEPGWTPIRIGTATITDNDPEPTLAVSDVAPNAVEGHSGNANQARFVVSLSNKSEKGVSVPYQTVPGTATAGGDYDTSSGTLTFGPQETSKAVNVPVRGDALDEVDETFELRLGTPTNAAVSDGTGRATITDDDAPPAVSIDNVTVGSEGGAGETQAASFTVSLAAPSAKTVDVAVSTIDPKGEEDRAAAAATPDEDYGRATEEVRILPGDTSASFDVTAFGDDVPEPDESFTVGLSNEVNASLGGASGTGTIVDDDLPTLTISNASVAEGNTGLSNASFSVNLSVAAVKPVGVHFATADGSADAPADYQATNGDLTFAPGEDSKQVTVPIKGDTLDEVSETFVVRLSSQVNALLGNTQGTGTIADDEAPDTTISAGPSDPTDHTPSFAFAGAGLEVSGFSCRVDNGPEFPCTSGAELGSIVDGSHTFRVAARDVHGNVDPTPAALTFHVTTPIPPPPSGGSSPPPSGVAGAAVKKCKKQKRGRSAAAAKKKCKVRVNAGA